MNDDRRPMSDERLAELMVKVTDGVATAMEREELMSHLKDRPGLLRELEAHAALKAVTDGWVERLQLDLVEDGHREGSMTRLEQGVGVTLFVLGAWSRRAGFSGAWAMRRRETSRRLGCRCSTPARSWPIAGRTRSSARARPPPLPGPP